MREEIVMYDMPLVSVIIPCYNAERYVEQAVRSIMMQTYQNLEILVTDDCSTDGSFAILERLATEDSRIKLFHNERNLKIVRTLNNMVVLAQGKYIARMDADDVSLPVRIERQVAFMEQNADISVCGTNAWHITENGRVIGRSFLPTTHKEIQIFKLCANPFYHPSVLAREYVLKENCYDEKFLYAEDYALWHCLLKLHKGYNLGEKLICYRILATTESQKSTAQQLLLHELAPNRNDIKTLAKIRPYAVRGNVLCSTLAGNGVKKRMLLSARLFFPLVLCLCHKTFLKFFGRAVRI